MTNSKNTKRALLASVLSLMLCAAMLVGSTFAWFTDSVQSGKNRIVAGNLDVELKYKNASTGDWADASVASVANPNFFVDKDGNDILWEPGVMAVTQFKVANVGSLALKYSLATLKADFNAMAGHDLSEVIKFAVVEGAQDYASRADVEAVSLTFEDFTEFKAEGRLLPAVKATEADPSEKIFTVVAYWAPTSNDNLYNVNNGQKTDDNADRLYIDIEISLYATQVEYENDSFGDDYDDVAMVTNAEELKTALSNGTQNVVLMADMEIGETIDITKDVNIDLNGKTISNNVSYDRIFYVTEPNVTLTINGTQEGSGICASDAADGKTYGIVDMRDGSAGSKLVVNGGTYTANTDLGALFRVRDDNVAVELNNVTATTNWWIFNNVNNYVGLGMTLTVNGGHFTSTNKVTAGDNTYSVFGFESIPADDKPSVNFTDTTIVSAGGACIELTNGIGEFNNCNFTVTDPSDPAFTASTLSVSGGGRAHINGGTYTSEGYGAYVYTSGGNIVIDGGAVITGKAKALASSAASYYFNPGQITLNDGTVNGDVYAYNDGDRPADITINGGSVDGNFSTSGTASATIHINGGTFTNDPTAYVDNTISSVTDNGNGTWTVSKQ